ncbi:spore germination protein GerPA/GerPF [Hydrogenispora ethanolica]|uniref:Spore germination protein GerPA/GerPF n=1 Tax=Hydrogenispora ethanolica TaxID=1082276 RepID=A0A4R1SA79_HYDET|nr:hypothetical protein [Hydrogenispora ethanolica]TCL76415.1 spore germination protein GerPA/GerPF [Hydrogenispora ethanolica]
MKELNFQLTIHAITIGTIENASSLNIGRNFLRDFKSMSKSNAGIGTVSGNHNSFPSSTNYVLDPDNVDMCWETQKERREEASRRGTPFARCTEERK